jgi:trimeric autotransporter adhesin
MQENPGNTVITPIGSQTMTEYGVALFPATATDGAQNNTIRDNVISLSPNYQNAIGILSTSANSYTHLVLSATSIQQVQTRSNKFYNNTISDVAYGMYFICPPVTATIYETGIVIGGTSSGNREHYYVWK